MGLGGNHLSNILSTSDKYQHDVDLDQYWSETETAHFRSIYDHDHANYPIVLAPHFWNANDILIQNLQTSSIVEFLVIHMPNNNQLAWKRFNTLNAKGQTDFQIQNFEYIHGDLQKLYKQQVLSMIYGGTWNTIFSDDLFSNNIDKVLDNLETNLNLKFPNRPLVRRIHIRWLTNLRLSLKIDQ